MPGAAPRQPGADRSRAHGWQRQPRLVDPRRPGCGRAGAGAHINLRERLPEGLHRPAAYFEVPASPGRVQCRVRPGRRGGSEEAVRLARLPHRPGCPSAGQRRGIVLRRSVEHIQEPRRVAGAAKFLEQQGQLEPGVAERRTIGCRLQHRERLVVPPFVDGQVREDRDRRGIVSGTGLPALPPRPAFRARWRATRSREMPAALRSLVAARGTARDRRPGTEQRERPPAGGGGVACT